MSEMAREDLMRLQAQLEAVQAELRDLRTRERSLSPLVAPFLGLPGQVGLWAAGATQRSTGNLYDLSGQGRTLTYNGNPAVNLINNLSPFYNLDGTGDFFSRADETDFDITAGETIFSTDIRGITAVGWFQLDSIAYAQARGFITKDDISTNRSYGLYVTTTGSIQAMASSNGSASTLSTGPQLSTANYFMGWMRWKPSTFLDAGINAPVSANYTRNTTSIPSGVFAGTAPFNIGSVNSDGTNRVIDGRFVVGTLCATCLTDEWLTYLFSATRGLLGV